MEREGAAKNIAHQLFRRHFIVGHPEGQRLHTVAILLVDLFVILRLLRGCPGCETCQLQFLNCARHSDLIPCPEGVASHCCRSLLVGWGLCPTLISGHVYRSISTTKSALDPGDSWQTFCPSIQRPPSASWFPNHHQTQSPAQEFLN